VQQVIVCEQKAQEAESCVIGFGTRLYVCSAQVVEERNWYQSYAKAKQDFLRHQPGYQEHQSCHKDVGKPVGKESQIKLEAFPRFIHRGFVIFLQNICVINVARAILRGEVFEYPDRKQVDDKQRDDGILRRRDPAENMGVTLHIESKT